MHRVERLSIREISKRTGLHRNTVRRALAAESPPRYSRGSAVSKLDPFREWICEQLRADPGIQSLRLREMAAELGYASTGLESWFSAICGSPGRWFRAGTDSCAAAMW